MTENLLQFLWLHRLYDRNEALKTTDGEPVLVIHPGMLNTHSGPDFLETKIKIGSTLWVGNAELHIRSSDWLRHQHQSDPSYDRLILHIVYEDDKPVKTYGDTEFPTIELKGLIPMRQLANFEKLRSGKGFIPCEKLFPSVDSLRMLQQKERMLAERIEDKTHHILTLMEQCHNHWEEVLYRLLARGFGLHINQEVFEQLAVVTPLGLLQKHKHNPKQMEALLFGQSGMLDDYFDESYPLQLQQEYAHLKKKYSLQSLEKHLWKFMRLRPANFPTLRIAQFAGLIHESDHLFSKIMNASSLKDLEAIFCMQINDYWLSHYTFQEHSPERNKNSGKAFIHTLIINVVVPLLYLYGKHMGKQKYTLQAFDLLRSLPAENNALIRQWKTLGTPVDHAADSQALLQLKNKYCDSKKCLECCIGFDIMKQ